MEGFIAVLVWIASIIIFSIIGGEIRFRYLKKKSTNQKDDEEQNNNKEEIIQGGFSAGGGTTLF